VLAVALPPLPVVQRKFPLLPIPFSIKQLANFWLRNFHTGELQRIIHFAPCFSRLIFVAVEGEARQTTSS
jgi:hypothetical protein